MPNEGILVGLTRLHSSDTAGEHENIWECGYNLWLANIHMDINGSHILDRRDNSVIKVMLISKEYTKLPIMFIIIVTHIL